jgi:hypothetical protein
MQTEDRIRMQSFTIKIDGEQYRQLMYLQAAEIADAQFQDLPPEEYPKLQDLIAAALSRGISAMYKEK